LRGLLVFLDPPTPSAVPALRRLSELGITTKVVTGDNAAVARRVCGEMGLPSDVVVTGPDVDPADDAGLDRLVAGASVFARASPEQKARIVRASAAWAASSRSWATGSTTPWRCTRPTSGSRSTPRRTSREGRGDVLLLEKDLDVLADGVAEVRRIFANTVKYVLMGTSSNLGNMLSAAGASRPPSEGARHRRRAFRPCSAGP
jgi:Mg2+-importing ATPase